LRIIVTLTNSPIKGRLELPEHYGHFEDGSTTPRANMSAA
jgi:hypothetical protein